MADDWYRKKTWTPQDREEFFKRLQRSRTPYHKAQYARIQAAELANTGKCEALVAALELFDFIEKEWPEEAGVQFWYYRAQCFAAFGDAQRAIDAYRRIFRIQREVKRGVFAEAHLDFGWMVVTTPMPDYYEEVLGLLVEFADYVLPVHRYRANAIAALIFDSHGQGERARDHARRALEEAAASHSGYRYHPTLGLVSSADTRIQERLQRLSV